MVGIPWGSPGNKNSMNYLLTHIHQSEIFVDSDYFLCKSTQ